MLSPYSSMVLAVWIMRSRIASAIVGSPTIGTVVKFRHYESIGRLSL